MSTIEDFKNAPTGATATLSNGLRVMRTGYFEGIWIGQNGGFMSDEQVAGRGYRLDQPTTAYDALELAWGLAYEVTVGQVIPEGTRYLEYFADGLKEYVAKRDIKARGPGLASMVRTLEPLPDPDLVPVPYWIDALAVIAETSMCPDRKIWVPESGGVWKCSCCRDELHWYELVDVTPLFPGGQEEEAQS